MKVAGILEDLSGTLGGAHSVLSNALDLVALEARRAGLSLALMLACGASGAILIVTAWLSLMAALALWAVGLGSGWQAAVAAVALANLAGAAALLWLCIWVSRGLLFPATRLQLRPDLTESA